MHYKYTCTHRAEICLSENKNLSITKGEMFRSLALGLLEGEMGG